MRDLDQTVKGQKDDFMSEGFSDSAGNFVAFDKERDYVVFDDGQYRVLGRNIRRDLQRNLDENFVTTEELEEEIEEIIQYELSKFEEQNLVFSSYQEFREYFKTTNVWNNALRNSLVSIIGGAVLGIYTASLLIGLTVGLSGAYFLAIHKAYKGIEDETEGRPRI